MDDMYFFSFFLKTTPVAFDWSLKCLVSKVSLFNSINFMLSSNVQTYTGYCLEDIMACSFHRKLYSCLIFVLPSGGRGVMTCDVSKRSTLGFIL